MCDFLSQVCFLCLCTNKDAKLVNVFSEDNDKILIIDKIEFLISSELLLLERNNPESVCTTCQNTLNNFYIYKQTCLENNRRLRYYINNKDNEPIQEEIEECKEEILENEDVLLNEIREEIDLFIKEEEGLLQEVDIKEEPIDDNISEEIKQEITEIHKRFLCNKCDKSYKHKYHLHRHLRQVHNERAYKCTVCSKTFEYKFQLKRHMVVYPHNQCGDCNSNFTDDDDFNAHLKVYNSKNQTFVCAYCGLQFYKKCVLKVHLKAHSTS